MRWFMACELEDSARRLVARAREDLVARLGRDSRSLIWVPDEKLHITLVFLGSLAPAVADDVARAAAVPFVAAPFECTLGGLGAFPTHDRPRVLWVGVHTERDELSALRRLVVARLAASGVTGLADERFHPHVTVGRVPHASRSLRAQLAQELGAATRVTGRTGVDHVTLFDSRIVDRRSVYDVVARAPLCWTPNSS